MAAPTGVVADASGQLTKKAAAVRVVPVGIRLLLGLLGAFSLLAARPANNVLRGVVKRYIALGTLAAQADTWVYDKKEQEAAIEVPGPLKAMIHAKVPPCSGVPAQ